MTPIGKFFPAQHFGWVLDKASPFAMGEFWSWLAKPKKSSFAKVAKGYTGKSTGTVEPLLYDHPQNHIDVVV